MQFLANVTLSIGAIYIAATCLEGIFSEISGTISPVWGNQTMSAIYLTLGLVPFAIKNKVGGIKTAGKIMLLSVILFLICEVVYLFKSKAIHEANKGISFTIPLIRSHNPLACFAKFFLLAITPSFNHGSLPIFHTIPALTVSKIMRPMMAAYIFILVVLILVSMLSMITFGELVSKHDTLLKVFYHNDHSLLAIFGQLIFSFIAFFHTPIYIFNARESMLFFFFTHCKAIRKPTPLLEEE